MSPASQKEKSKLPPRKFSIDGQIVDVVNGRIFPGEVFILEGKIAKITKLVSARPELIMPGLVDAHIHIESSMLPPSEFARLAVVHGTVSTVSDPHEIANVLGIAGVEYMLKNAEFTPFKFNFGAPSCVPATAFETTGATMDGDELEFLLKNDDIRYLGEMMNFPGVLARDPLVINKIESAKRIGKPIDGHSPGLRGKDAETYINAGISTDHECVDIDEAREKLELGMKIIIREGSAAKNFDTLISLLNDYPDKIMFCSDDKHPDELVLGHINGLVRRAILHGIKPMQAFRAATLNPIRHYKLNVGLLQEGDPADFIVVSGIHDFEVKATYIDGQKVGENGQSLIDPVQSPTINKFNCDSINIDDIQIKAEGTMLRVIKVFDGQLITKETVLSASVDHGKAVTDTNRDLLKLVVVNRYEKKSTPALAFVTGMGLKNGAFASSVAHDCHNIIAVGVEDENICKAINLIVDQKGGLSYSCGTESGIIPLPIAGLMSTKSGYEIAKDYKNFNHRVNSLGNTLQAPFMTLSFLALLVIPELKLSDKGLFNGKSFEFVNVFL